MLSRARRGMFICSNRVFLQSAEARRTLIGRMAEEWACVDGGWIEELDDLARKLYIA